MMIPGFLYRALMRLSHRFNWTAGLPGMLRVDWQHSDKVKFIAVGAGKRMKLLPDMPTVAESGLPGYEIVGWHGIFAPAGTPREIVERLSNTIGKILGAADIRELWNTQAMEIFPSTPEQFAARLRFDYERYSKLIRDAGIKLQ